MTYQKNKVIVQSRDKATTQVLTNFDFNTLQITRTKNEAYQIDLTAYDDHSIAFNLLTIENLIIFNGQTYVIKQATDDNTGGVHSVNITAMHIFYQLNQLYQYNVKTGDNSFTLAQALKYLFAGVSGGYAYRIHGTFNGSKTLTDFGNTPIVEGLSTLKSTFGIYAIVPDGLTIHLYDEKSYVTDTNKVFRYLYDTAQVQLQFDSSTMVNAVQAVSTMEKPAFKPFTVKDDDSIAKWGLKQGARVESDTITDTNAMKTLASQSFVLEPTISLTVSTAVNEEVTIGEKWTVQIPAQQITTKVEVISVVDFPLSPTTPQQVTLNNTRVNFLDVQRAQLQQLKQAQTNAKNSAVSNMWTVGEV